MRKIKFQTVFVSVLLLSSLIFPNDSFAAMNIKPAYFPPSVAWATHIPGQITEVNFTEVEVVPDINGDGKDEIVAGNNQLYEYPVLEWYEPVMIVLLNGSDGTELARNVLTPRSNGHALDFIKKFRDINGDRVIELLVSTNWPQQDLYLLDGKTLATIGRTGFITSLTP